MELREAAQMALDALEEFCEHGAILRPLDRRDALRAALAQPEREWQGLTDEERQECLYSDPIFGMAASTFARAVEAKLREKNFDRPS